MLRVPRVGLQSVIEVFPGHTSYLTFREEAVFNEEANEINNYYVYSCRFFLLKTIT